jgi:hypothetical protein
MTKLFFFFRRDRKGHRRERITLRFCEPGQNGNLSLQKEKIIFMLLEKSFSRLRQSGIFGRQKA